MFEPVNTQTMTLTLPVTTINTMTDLGVAFGRRLRQIREERGLTQAELADRVYVTRSAIAQVETGRSGMSTEVMQRVARVLEVSLDELTGDGSVGPTAVERQLEFAKEAVQAVAGVPIRYYGDVPAALGCWQRRPGEGMTTPVQSDWLGNLSPDSFFVTRASDDGFAARGILPGHFVLCLRSVTPHDGDLVLVRIGQSVDLCEWHWNMRDGIEVEGVVVRSWSPELRPLR